MFVLNNVYFVAFLILYKIRVILNHEYLKLFKKMKEKQRDQRKRVYDFYWGNRCKDSK